MVNGAGLHSACRSQCLYSPNVNFFLKFTRQAHSRGVTSDELSAQCPFPSPQAHFPDLCCLTCSLRDQTRTETHILATWERAWCFLQEWAGMGGGTPIVTMRGPRNLAGNMDFEQKHARKRIKRPHVPDTEIVSRSWDPSLVFEPLTLCWKID